MDPHFDVPKNRSDETRRIVMKNSDAVLTPSRFTHTGSDTAIWAMGSGNQAFDGMDTVPTHEVR